MGYLSRFFGSQALCGVRDCFFLGKTRGLQVK